jgi:hypothetical protein
MLTVKLNRLPNACVKGYLTSRSIDDRNGSVMCESTGAKDMGLQLFHHDRASPGSMRIINEAICGSDGGESIK